MDPRVPRRVVVVVAALTLLVAAAGAWFWWQSTQRTSYQQAVAWLPEETLRVTWTDWAQVRAAADGEDLDAGSSSRDVGGFLDRAYDLDLTGTSAVVEATYAMGRRYGFSPLDAAWEAFGQSREGQVAVLRLGDAADPAGIERRLRRLGYEAPADGAGSGGVWSGSADLLASIDPSLSPVLQYVVVDAGEGVVLLSDDRAYASAAASVVAGDAEGLDAVAGTTDLAGAAGEPVSSVLLASDFACEALSMGAADDGDQAAARQLVEDAGGVSPLTGFVAALQPDRSLVVGMRFEDASQASDDLRPRVALAAGDAPGQGGTFGERFRVVEAAAEDREIVMQLEPAADDLPLLSDLTQGPLLFATC